MYPAFQHTHSLLAYVFLALMLFLLFRVLQGYTNRRPFSDGTRKLALVSLIFAHVQLLLGLGLYFVFSPMGFKNLNSATMKDSISRLFALEHPLMMVLGIVFITIGYSRSKRAGNDIGKYRQLLIFYAVGLLLILSRIPWHQWPGL
jgi:hypothetical protein